MAAFQFQVYLFFFYEISWECECFQNCKKNSFFSRLVQTKSICFVCVDWMKVPFWSNYRIKAHVSFSRFFPVVQPLYHTGSISLHFTFSLFTFFNQTQVRFFFKYSPKKKSAISQKPNHLMKWSAFAGWKASLEYLFKISSSLHCNRDRISLELMWQFGNFTNGMVDFHAYLTACRCHVIMCPDLSSQANCMEIFESLFWHRYKEKKKNPLSKTGKKQNFFLLSQYKIAWCNWTAIPFPSGRKAASTRIRHGNFHMFHVNER